ncbi:hypothetical protein MP478_17590 [Chryseobacterium sp. WG14]|uniref:bacteriocin-like protein n=1 Tax=unclassified Chryseobacterium TaxID=2593645 RepID=UPI001E28736C|nr:MULTISPECIES: hypothetical protein [unclassified Chryseobacterium]MCQ9634515.1 hypothetical protein [Chryseobacterium sp. WG23]MCQ9641197.1 hypothetical protein [Chryseobacterium sp. WG14]
MKNLRKLTKKNLKVIQGGTEKCPPITSSCSVWCGWSAWQKIHCLTNTYEEPCVC